MLFEITSLIAVSAAGAPADGTMQQSGDSGSPSFNPLAVLEFMSDTKEEAIAWLLSRIRAPQQAGGVTVR